MRIVNVQPSSETSVRIEPTLCMVCGFCYTVCPLGAIKLDQNGIPYITDQCIGCGTCIDECPAGAIYKSY